MKVSFFKFHPHTLFSKGGGETMFINLYQNFIDRGLDVSMHDIWKHKIPDIDIFHLFGSHDAISEVFLPLQTQKIPLVVSAIDYMNMPLWKLKTLKTAQTICPLPLAYKNRQKLFDYASAVIVNSNEEYKYLTNYFNIAKEKIFIVPVGVSENFAVGDNSFVEKYEIEDYILCVGRIGSRKQQIKILETLIDLDKPIVFIGQEDPSEPEYFKMFQELIKKYPKAHWIGQLDNHSNLLSSAYKHSAVHVLPSHPPEFPGISSLEAGIAGTRVVTTKAPTVTTTMEEFAYYCSHDEQSILETVSNALREEKNNRLKEHLVENFTWNKIGEQVLEVYKFVIENRNVKNR